MSICVSEASPTCAEIFHALVEVSELPSAQLRGEHREHHIAHARRVGMLVMANFGYPTEAIAEAFERDIRTVCSSRRTAARMLNTDQSTRFLHERLIARLEQRMTDARRARQSKAAKVSTATQDCARAPTRDPDADDVVVNFDEIRRLRRLGWSIGGLVRRFERTPQDIADVIGEPFQGCV